MELSFADLLAGTEASRDAIAARFAGPSLADDETDETGPQGDEDEDQGAEQGDAPETLSETAIERLIETASQPGPTSPPPTGQGPDDNGLEDEATTDAGKRSPARRSNDLGDAFARAIFDYRDAGSAPRGLHAARRRKAKGVGVFGETR